MHTMSVVGHVHRPRYQHQAELRKGIPTEYGILDQVGTVASRMLC